MIGDNGVFNYLFFYVINENYWSAPLIFLKNNTDIIVAISAHEAVSKPSGCQCFIPSFTAHYRLIDSPIQREPAPSP